VAALLLLHHGQAVFLLQGRVWMQRLNGSSRVQVRTSLLLLFRCPNAMRWTDRVQGVWLMRVTVLPLYESYYDCRLRWNLLPVRLVFAALTGLTALTVHAGG
jgi:hypothetical protein